MSVRPHFHKCHLVKAFTVITRAGAYFTFFCYLCHHKYDCCAISCSQYVYRNTETRRAIYNRCGINVFTSVVCCQRSCYILFLLVQGHRTHDSDLSTRRLHLLRYSALLSHPQLFNPVLSIDLFTKYLRFNVGRPFFLLSPFSDFYVPFVNLSSLILCAYPSRSNLFPTSVILRCHSDLFS